MSPKLLIINIVIMAWAASGWSQTETIDICTDQNYWYPFSYADRGEAKGIHIDIASRALKNFEYTSKFSPLPWKRCLEAAAQGKFDAVVSASYKPERAQHLIYPPDAAEASTSDWRIMQVEYVVITSADSSYRFQGNIQTLPKPVRAPLGYAIVDDLKAEGIEVVTAPDIRECMQQLILSRRGTVITPPQNARRMNEDPRFRRKFKIHRQSVKSKSYFMVFSRKIQKLQLPEIGAIWTEIARLRNDPVYIDQLFDFYSLTEKTP